MPPKGQWRRTARIGSCAPNSTSFQLPFGESGAGRQTFVFPWQDVVEGEAERVAAALQRRRPPLALPADGLQADRQVVGGRWRWKRTAGGDGEEGSEYDRGALDLGNKRRGYLDRRPSRTRRP